MSTQSKEIKSAAIERSLLDLDRLREQGVEFLSLGKSGAACEIFSQLIAGLEERFAAFGKNTPIDVLTRRFRALLLMADALSADGREEESPAFLIEANTLAKTQLADFPEFIVRSDFELARLFYKRKDAARMKKYIDEANALVKANPEPQSTAMLRFASGLLFACAGRHNDAVKLLSATAGVIDESSGLEQAMLKAGIMFALSDEYERVGALDQAASDAESAAKMLMTVGEKAFSAGATGDALQMFLTAAAKAGALSKKEANTKLLGRLYIDIADTLDVKGRWNIAAEYYGKAVGLFQGETIAEPETYSLAYIGLGGVSTQNKDYAAAATHLNHARKCCEEYKNVHTLALCLYHLGLNTSKSGDDNKAVALFEESLDLLRDLKAGVKVNSLRASINNQLGFIAAKRSGVDQALSHFEESVDLMREFSGEIALGEAYRLMGEIHCRQGQHIQSERALKKALDIFERRGAAYECARCYKSIGDNTLGAGDLAAAGFFMEESIAILEELGLESDLPMVYSARARVCIMQEDLEEAEKLYQKDFDISKRSGSQQSMAFSLFQLGRVRRLLKRPSVAEDLLQRSHAIFESVGNQWMAAHSLTELALCVSVRKDVKTATDMAARAQAIFEQRKERAHIAAVSLARGIILRDTKDPKRRNMAQRFFEDAIHAFEKHNRVSIELAEAYFEFGLFWRDAKDRKKATDLVAQAIELCRKLGLTKKASVYLEELQGISPEDATKLRFSSLVDKAAVEQFAKAKSGEGVTVERKNLSILFTDIRGFTTISESLELDMLTSFLNDFYGDVFQAIQKYQGSVNKFIGDAVMAIFNMDGKLKNHAELAVRAAVELARSIKETNMMRRRRGEIDINIGVGINTGEVLIGGFGTALRQDYTAIGDCVNVASRIQNLAKFGEIIITPEVYTCVEGIVKAESMGEQMLKGRDKPVNLWKIIDLKD